MEDLLRALRNIGLATPDHEQLLQLSNPDPDVQEKLTQLIALNPSSQEYQAEPTHDDDDDDEDLDPFMDADLFKGAVAALLENYNKFIEKERDLLQREHQLLANPNPIKPVPLKALLARQDAEIKRNNKDYHAAGHDPETGKAKNKFYLPRQTFDGYGSYASDKPFESLKMMDIDEFQAPKRFEGRYVLCKVASSLNLYLSCTFIAKLPSGEGIPVSISHFTTNLHLRGEELDRYLLKGTMLAIREPYISINHFGKGGPATGGKTIHGIRVDSPADIYIIDGGGKYDRQLLKPSSWQCPFRDWCTIPNAVGQECSRWMQEGPLTRLVEVIKEEDIHGIYQIVLYCYDLVESLLKHDRPGAAYRELLLTNNQADVFGMDKEPELEGKVLHRLGAYEEACEKFQSALIGTRWKEADEATRERIYPLLLASREAAKTSKEGPTHENVWTYYFDSSTYPVPRFDLRDWLGPVAVKDIAGAGRGLVLTRDVSEGELLLSCKALASSYAKDAGINGIAVLRHCVETGVTSTTTQVIAATKTILAMMDRQELIPSIMGLTAGPDVPHSKWVREKYATPKDERPVAFRAKTMPAINAAYVHEVLRFNAFGPSPNPHTSSDLSELSRSTMVHPLPAILNHACLPNVTSVFFGDVVTTRALHPLKAGTEIMHQYVRGEQPWPLRRSQLSKHGFKCGCEICLLDQEDGEEACRERQRLVGGTMGMMNERSRMITKSDDIKAHRDLAEALVSLAEQVDNTYKPSRKDLKPDLTSIWQKVAKHTDKEVAIQAELNALRFIGAELEEGKLTRLPDLHFDAAITSLLSLAQLQGENEAAWIKAAMHAHESTIGGGADVFLDRWESVYPQLPLRKHLK